MIHNLVLTGLGKTGFKESYEGQINDLLEVAPSDACATSKIVKMKEGYFGILQIFSAEGRFDVHAKCGQLDDLVKALVTQMHGHIKSWRKYRFLRNDDELPLNAASLT